jgi:hypothetical protein
MKTDSYSINNTSTFYSISIIHTHICTYKYEYIRSIESIDISISMKIYTLILELCIILQPVTDTITISMHPFPSIDK